MGNEWQFVQRADKTSRSPTNSFCNDHGSTLNGPGQSAGVWHVLEQVLELAS